MPDGALAIEQTDGDGVSTLVLRGDLDINTARQFRERVGAMIDTGAGHIVLDPQALEFIDSSGLGELVAALKQMRRQDGILLLQSPRPVAMRLFQITGLDRIFGIEHGDTPAG